MISMILKFIFPSLTTLYAIFFLGAIPLPPVPGRPFLAEGTGISKFPPLNPYVSDLAALGRTTPGLIAFGLFVFLFLFWSYASRKTFSGRRPIKIRVLQFIFIFILSFISADYSRELLASTPEEYAKVRIDWIRQGASPGYPRWPTLQLKKALISRNQSAIRDALEAVVKPEFGKIPAFASISSSCITVLQDRIEGSTGIIAERDEDENFFFVCRLLTDLIPFIGRRDVNDPTSCLYGPAVKVLHALDRQHFTCRLASLPGAPSAETICPALLETFGTRAFKFCSP